MSLQTKVVEAWKNALKNKDPKKDTLSLINTEFKNRAIKDGIMGESGRVIPDTIAIEVLQKMAKQRKEAIEAYQVANRNDLVDKEKLELSVVESYLPRALNDDELRAIVAQAIKDLGASSMKEMGAVMGVAIKAAQGRADGKRVQEMVQTLLK